MNTLTTTRAELRTADPEEMILALSDCYTLATKVFVRFLHERGLGLDAEGIAAFSAYLRDEHDGRRYAARSVNFYLGAVKNRVRYLLDYAPNIGERTRTAVERVLSELKAEKVEHEGVNAERCLTYDQVRKVIAAAQRSNPRVALIAEFLAVTGCRITETLQILNTDVRTAGEQYRVTLHGKGGKDRKVYVSAELVKRIRRVFVGRKWLFAHSSTQRLYTRTYISTTLSRIGERSIGRGSPRTSSATRGRRTCCAGTRRTWWRSPGRSDTRRSRRPRTPISTAATAAWTGRRRLPGSTWSGRRHKA